MINHPFVDSRLEVAPRLEANKQDSLEAYVDSKIMCNLRCLCFQIPGKSPNTGLNGTGTNSLNQITPGTRCENSGKVIDSGALLCQKVKTLANMCQ